MLNRKLISAALFVSAFTPVFSQDDGDVFFSQPIVHEVRLNFSQTGYWDSLEVNMDLEEYMAADVTIDGVSYSDVGVKFKGNSSFNNPSDKKPFKIDMNEYVSGQDVDGLKKFNLNNGFKDPSFLREKLALDFYNDHGLAAPRCAYTKVYINDVYWGLYTFVEEVNKGFLEDRFGGNDGNLFKGDPSGDLKWMGATASSYYTKYELHTNETANDWTDLVALINAINNSGTGFETALEAEMNVESFIGQWAAMNLFVNLDSYIGSGHNYFLYHDTITDKFEWVAWDVNESFGNFNMGMNSSQILNLSMFYVSSPSSSRPLIQKMLTVPAYKQTLVYTICEWLESDFTNATLDPKIDSLANAIRDAVYADTKKFNSNADFENNISNNVGPTLGVKSFISSRRAALMTELAANGCNVGLSENTEEQFSAYPVPTNEDVTLVFPSGGERTIVLTNMMGQEVITQEATGQTVLVSMAALPDGVYLVSVNGQMAGRVQKVD